MSNRTSPVRPALVTLPGAARRLSTREERTAARNEMVERLSPHCRSVVERLNAIRQVYVRCGRDNYLDDTLKGFMQTILSTDRNGMSPGLAYFITGESGAGKTYAIREMLRRSSALAPVNLHGRQVSPVISVSMKGVTTLRILAERIFIAAGYDIKETSQSLAWSTLNDFLAERRIMVVHLDEVQHMMRKTQKDAERKSLSDALKGVMNDEEWPVSFILSGLPYVAEMARLDEQYERRDVMVKLSDIDTATERKLVERILRQLATAGDLGVDQIIQSDVPERLAHSVRYRYGRICQATIMACQIAIQNGAVALCRDHFAQAYLLTSHARGHDHMNPFLATDFLRLPPGCFIIEEAESA